MAGKRGSYERVLGLRRNIINWEQGYHRPNMESVQSLADALEVSSEDILALYESGGGGGQMDTAEFTRFFEWAISEYRRKTQGVTA
jgi:transcriptional regulator with XRE-family HTH domain